MLDQILAKLTAALGELTPLGPMDEKTTQGPLSTEAALLQLQEQVDAAVKGGATLLMGGKRIDRPGAFMQATILSDITPENPAFRDEFFGPVASFYRVKDEMADIAIVDLKKDKMDAVAKEVKALGRKATVFVADVTSRDQVYAAVDHAETELGGFDIMVNNAGIAQVQPLADVTPQEVETIFKVNIEGVIWGVQAAAKKFKARGHKGKIISALSVAGHTGFAMLGVYSATKFAIRGLTQAAALEYASDDITVNAYCPGIVGTDMWVEIDERFAKLTGAAKGETYEKYVDGIALGRAEIPADVAAFVSYLAGPDSDYMTGQAPIIDGGLVYR
ncbi:MAG: meso-butanediol dehydrogenase/(S,S)-butanediol dehydrogenase/diacetyl reductase [Halioglobus sp.]